MRQRFGVTMIVVLAACAPDGPDFEGECKPLEERCDAHVIQGCFPDVELARRGRRVYVWTDVAACEEHEVCVEHPAARRIEARCDLQTE